MTTRLLIGLMISAAVLTEASASTMNPPMTPEAAQAVMAREMESRPAPFVGRKAPKLRVAEWIQGDPVRKFVPGETYVVEMWATWCGPCIAVIPHLNKLHLEYQEDEDRNVTFIGMNVLDARNGEDRRERAARIERFIEARNGEMTYRVAYEDEQLMSETWMEPAGQRGLPTTFIVDGDGRIAWVGQPTMIDEPLTQIVQGEYDVEQAKLELVGQLVLNEALDALQRGGELKPALDRLEALTLTAFKDNPETRAKIGYLVSQTQSAGEAGRAWSLRIAQAAVDQADEQQALPYAMLAHVMEANGDTRGAVKHMKNAVRLNEDDQLEQFFQSEVARLEAIDS